MIPPLPPECQCFQLLSDSDTKQRTNERTNVWGLALLRRWLGRMIAWRSRRQYTLAEMENICRQWAEDADANTRAALLELAETYRKEQGPPR